MGRAGRRCRSEPGSLAYWGRPGRPGSHTAAAGMARPVCSHPGGSGRPWGRLGTGAGGAVVGSPAQPASRGQLSQPEACWGSC